MASGERCGICGGVKAETCLCTAERPGPAVRDDDADVGVMVRPYVNSQIEVEPVAVSVPGDDLVVGEDDSGATVSAPDGPAAAFAVPQGREGPPVPPSQTSESKLAESGSGSGSGGATGGLSARAAVLGGGLRGRWRGLSPGARAALVAGLALALFGAGAVFEHARESGTGRAASQGSAPVGQPPPPPVTATVTVTGSPTATPSGSQGKPSRSPPVTVTAEVTPPPPRAAPLTCVVDYDVIDERDDEFEVDVDIQLFGDGAVDGWTLRWRFPDDRSINELQDAHFDQDGASATFTNNEDNGVIVEDEPVDFEFVASGGGDPDAEPIDAFLNGVPCAVD